MSAVRANSQSAALRKLYLNIFLRGRSGRSATKGSAPKSIARKLLLTLLFYALFGLFALAFMRQPIFALSVYLHASTLMFLGMFVASSAGEALFNKEEADILMHRPITPQSLLWAKMTVIAQISLWLAIAFNLAGFVAGAMHRQGGPQFILAHAISITLESFFCIGLVIVTYQLCLRWFGRERLESIITTAQTFMAIAIVLGSQLAPQWLMRSGKDLNVTLDSWWILCLPPAWFAGIDDTLGGSRTPGAWALALAGVLATGLVLWAALNKLARDYTSGLQLLNENVSPPKRRSGKPFLEIILDLPVVRWWLKDSVARAAFRLCVAYLFRDRDVKLRVFPGLAPMLVMPIIFLLPKGNRSVDSFGLAFGGTYLGLIPLMGLNFLKYSQQWQSSDVFRAAPLAGPASLCHGARKAVFLTLTLPILFIFTALFFAFGGNISILPMLLPGLIALPVFALIPCLRGEAVPFSQPAEEAQSAGRGLHMLGVVFVSMLIAAGATVANQFGYLWPFLGLEAILTAIAYGIMRRMIARAVWKPLA